MSELFEDNGLPNEEPEEPEVRTTIFAPSEAAQVLDYEDPAHMSDKVMGILAPGVNGILKAATGKDWSEDEDVDPVAKAAAGILLARLFNNMAQDEKGTKLIDDSLIALVGMLNPHKKKEENGGNDDEEA